MADIINNIDELCERIKSGDLDALYLAGTKITKNVKNMLRLIELMPKAIEIADDALIGKRKFVFEAIKVSNAKNGYAIIQQNFEQRMTPSSVNFFKEKSFLLELQVQNNFNIISMKSQVLITQKQTPAHIKAKDSEELTEVSAMDAIKISSNAYKYFSPELQRDRDIIREAVITDPTFFDVIETYAHKLKDREVANLVNDAEIKMIARLGTALTSNKQQNEIAATLLDYCKTTKDIDNAKNLATEIAIRQLNQIKAEENLSAEKSGEELAKLRTNVANVSCIINDVGEQLEGTMLKSFNNTPGAYA